MCESDTLPSIACSAHVRTNCEIAPGIFELVVNRKLPVDQQTPSLNKIPLPLAGQFFMLRARPSGVLLGRPISIYTGDEDTLTFLILKKGKGTAELCALREGESVDLLGPIGNRFLTPAELAENGSMPLPSPRIAIIGGGIGVAPVAGFALMLKPKTFDFYASFRSATYGLYRIESHAQNLIITTEDGSTGEKGMLNAVFDPVRYDLVYACGPTPMLRYLQEVCKTAGPAHLAPLVFLSLEEHMACGAGVCLGCTVRTTDGNRRCCVDGPVFNAAEVFL